MTDFQWVFLIGAARSGTKFLRDTLASSDEIACIPYDVGYVWRDGQESVLHDELASTSATPQRVSRIRRTLERLARRNGAKPGQIVIEKTVGNTLRVDFIRACFPEARFIYLEREPLDTIASAYGEWVTPVDRSYLFEKLRYFPIRSWRYGLWFVRNQLSRRDSQPIWGPRFEGITDDLESDGVIQVVTRQYLKSVSSARQLLSADDAFAIRYADLAAAGEKWQELLRWLGISDGDAVTQRLKSSFRPGAGWPGQLTPEQQSLVHDAISGGEL